MILTLTADANHNTNSKSRKSERTALLSEFMHKWPEWKMMKMSLKEWKQCWYEEIQNCWENVSTQLNKVMHQWNEQISACEWNNFCLVWDDELSRMINEL